VATSPDQIAPSCAYSRTEPCPTCPWRRSSTVGGFDIPGFDIEKMRGLSNTVGHGDEFRPIMACHYSTFAAEDYPCVGYIAQEGWSNLAVRMAAIEDRIDVRAINYHCEPLDLWPDFASMLAAYEEAIDTREEEHAE
jgi:hypothetical protein